MTILGIETSHDDTSLALLKNGKVCKMVTFSQIDLHAKYGGTIPELASREHVNNVAIVLEEFKKDFDLAKIDYIAYTSQPGLLGALHIGYLFATALALALKKPLIPINHLVGHIYSVELETTQKIVYPALALIVSGGHTQLMKIKNYHNIEIIGQTQDDAVGEVYDKVARKLGLGFPGGPIIDQLASDLKNHTNLRFTIPITKNPSNFSLSGVKTQVINYINKLSNKQITIPINQIAYAFQKTIIEYLKQKIVFALQNYEKNNFQTLILAGGVSANSEIRQMVLELHPHTLIPNLKYATDNGAMIAKAAEISLQEQRKKQ